MSNICIVNVGQKLGKACKNAKRAATTLLLPFHRKWYRRRPAHDQDGLHLTPSILASRQALSTFFVQYHLLAFYPLPMTDKVTGN